MEAIRLHKIVERDGEILLTGLPYKRGQHVEMILLLGSSATSTRSGLTADRLLNSGLIGIWKGRKDVEDSAVYARQLRDQAQNRQR